MDYSSGQQSTSSLSGAGSPSPRQETVGEVLLSVNDSLRSAKGLLCQLEERVIGPMPAAAEKASGCGPGMLAQAFEARTQAQQICRGMERIMAKL